MNINIAQIGQLSSLRVGDLLCWGKRLALVTKVHDGGVIVQGLTGDRSGSEYPVGNFDLRTYWMKVI
jgi:hypothetical protein